MRSDERPTPRLMRDFRASAPLARPSALAVLLPWGRLRRSAPFQACGVWLGAAPRMSREVAERES